MQSSKIEFVLNLKTAKPLRVDVPPKLSCYFKLHSTVDPRLDRSVRGCNALSNDWIRRDPFGISIC
jgi:hypothetical protein